MNDVMIDRLLKVGTVSDLISFNRSHVLNLARQGAFMTEDGRYYFCDEPVTSENNKKYSNKANIRIFESGLRRFIDRRSIRTRTLKRRAVS